MDGIEKLIELLQDVVDGKEVTDDEVNSLRWPQGISTDLEDTANECCFRLKLFMGDDDIRSSDPEYDKDMRHQIGDYLAFMREMLTSEPERVASGRRVKVPRSNLRFKTRTAVIFLLILLAGVLWLLT